MATLLWYIQVIFYKIDSALNALNGRMREFQYMSSLGSHIRMGVAYSCKVLFGFDADGSLCCAVIKYYNNSISNRQYEPYAILNNMYNLAKVKMKPVS